MSIWTVKTERIHAVLEHNSITLFSLTALYSVYAIAHNAKAVERNMRTPYKEQEKEEVSESSTRRDACTLTCQFIESLFNFIQLTQMIAQMRISEKNAVTLVAGDVKMSNVFEYKEIYENAHYIEANKIFLK